MNNEQSPALRQAVENMDTMREAYDNLSQAAEAYNTGKVQLAANITSKGVTASASETLPELAEKVSAISQQPIILSPSEVGDMYAVQQFGSLTTPNYWNLYEVLNTLLNDGRLINYGGILLAEYYKGYDSLALSGAGAGGAYVVSDMENGQFKMYTNDTTHTWATEDDGKGNRWVAYCFADAGHGFEITDTNTSPRSIFIGRKVGSINSVVDTRISQIVVTDGNSINSFNSAFRNKYGKSLVVRNIKNQNGTFYAFGSTAELFLESVYLEIDNVVDGILIQGGFSAAQPPLVGAIFNINKWSGGALFGSAKWQMPCLYITNLITGNAIQLSYNTYTNFEKLKQLYLIDCELGAYSGGAVADLLEYIYVGYKTNDKEKTCAFTYYHINMFSNVNDCELKNGWCKPLDVRYLSSLTESNIYSHILQRLKQDEADCGDGVTITLGATNLAKLTSAESVQLLDDLTNIYGYTFA